MHIDENNFIDELKFHNEHALMYVIDTYGGLVRSVIQKHLYALPDYQEECMDDVLLSVWNHIEAFCPEKNSFKNWIAAIARYKAIDYMRKYKEDVVVLPLDEAVNLADPKTEKEPESRGLDKIWVQEIEGFLSCLKPADREIFERLYLQGESINEICDNMGLSSSVVYNRISRGKKRMQQLRARRKSYGK